MIIDCTGLTAAYLADLRALYKAAWQEELIDCISSYVLSKDDPLSFTTSGSTGTPQEIHRSRAMVVQSAARTIKSFALEQVTSALLCLPIRYIAGRMMIYRAIEYGWTLYCIEPRIAPSIDSSWQIDFSACIPLQVEKLIAKDSIDQIKKMIIGGSRISHDLRVTISGISTICYETYGMTETLTHVAARRVKEEVSFVALDGVKFSLGDNNVLVIQDPICGTFATTDVIQLHSDTSFTLLGRTDRIINMGGLKIHPEELEQKIEPFMKCSYFIAKERHSELDSVPVLYVECEEDALRVQAHLSERTQRPRRFYKVKMKYTVSEKLITRPEAYPEAQEICQLKSDK